MSHSTDDGSGALRGEFNSFRGFQSDGPRGSRARAEVKAAFAEMMEEIGKSAWGRRLADRETLMEKTRSQWCGDPLPYEYWMKPTEIFARALESVVSLRVDGYTSGYYAPYPTLEETLEPIVFHFFAKLEEGVNETTGLATLYSTDTGASVGGDVVDAMEVLASGKDATLQNGKLGSILFPFGKMGKGGTGFLHIVERRMAQGHSLDEAVWIAAHVGEAAARGEDTLPEDGRPMYNTKWLDKDGYRAIVAFDKNGQAVITGYEIDEKARADADAHRRSARYAQSPHVSSEDVVAALKKIIAQMRGQKQGGASYSDDSESGGDVKPSWSVDDAGGTPWTETAEGREMVRAAFHVLMKRFRRRRWRRGTWTARGTRASGWGRGTGRRGGRGRRTRRAA